MSFSFCMAPRNAPRAAFSDVSSAFVSLRPEQKLSGFPRAMFINTQGQVWIFQRQNLDKAHGFTPSEYEFHGAFPIDSIQQVFLPYREMLQTNGNVIACRTAEMIIEFAFASIWLEFETNQARSVMLESLLAAYARVANNEFYYEHIELEPHQLWEATAMLVQKQRQNCSQHSCDYVRRLGFRTIVYERAQQALEASDLPHLKSTLHLSKLLREHDLSAWVCTMYGLLLKHSPHEALDAVTKFAESDEICTKYLKGNQLMELRRINRVNKDACQHALEKCTPQLSSSFSKSEVSKIVHINPRDLLSFHQEKLSPTGQITVEVRKSMHTIEYDRNARVSSVLAEVIRVHDRVSPTEALEISGLRNKTTGYILPRGMKLVDAVYADEELEAVVYVDHFSSTDQVAIPCVLCGKSIPIADIETHSLQCWVN